MEAISNSTMFGALRANGLLQPILVDNYYALLDDDKAEDFFRAVVAESKNILPEYRPDSSDCDKFSRFVQGLCIGFHAMQCKGAAGLAVGVLNYTRAKPRGGHSINFLVTKVKGRQSLKVRYFEGENATELVLLDSEKASASVCLM